MTPQSLIDAALTYFEGLDPNDLGNLRNRAQALLLLQQVLDEVENERDLKYLYKDDATMTLAAAGTTATPPTDYRDMGMEGKLYVPLLSRDVEGPKMDQEILDARYYNGQAPRCIEEFGFWNGLFQFAVADAAYAFQLHYLRKTAILVDDTTPFVMPVQYHSTVLLSGVLSRTNMVKDELRNEQANVHQRNKAQMYVRERPRRGGVQVWPAQPGVAT